MRCFFTAEYAESAEKVKGILAPVVVFGGEDAA
jgi:hypothetical protein